MNPPRFVDLVIGDVHGGVIVPMVSQFGANILEWNAKVPHCLDFVFIFVNNFLSHNGAILPFHSNDLWILKQIKKFLNSYSMSIQMKWVVVNNCRLISIKDFELEIFICSHILSILLYCCRLFISILNALLSSCKMYLLGLHFWWGPPKLFSSKHLLLTY